MVLRSIGQCSICEAMGKIVELDHGPYRLCFDCALDLVTLLDAEAGDAARDAVSVDV
jgi:hypothetical protein